MNTVLCVQATVPSGVLSLEAKSRTELPLPNALSRKLRRVSLNSKTAVCLVMTAITRTVVRALTFDLVFDKKFHSLLSSYTVGFYTD